MARGIMGLVRDFNQITYAARTLERIQKAKETKWSVQVSHAGLGRSKVIRGSSKQFVEAEASQQLAAWNTTWQQQEESARNRATRAFERRSAEQRVAFVAEQKAEAERRTDAAKAEIAAAEGILAGFANFDGKLEWETLNPDPAYTIVHPKLPPLGSAPTPPVIAEEPKRSSLQYELDVLVAKRCIAAPPPKPEIKKVGFVGKLFGTQKRAHSEYKSACATWNTELRKYEATAPALIDQIFATDHQNWERTTKQATDNYDEANSRRTQEAVRQAIVIEHWNQLRDTWDVLVAKLAQKIDNCRTGYASGAPLAVADYFSAILAMTEHPVWVPQARTIFYEPDFRRLNVSYRLPHLDDVPSIAAHNYVQKNDSFVEVELKKGQKDALYDSITYQLSLRCFHDLFKSDAASILDEIQFTGYIRGVSAATGTDQETVILSARCTRPSFDKINLALVEPASCFLALQKATQTKPHLFKPVSLPAIVPDSGDDGLPLVKNATGELFCILSYSGQSVLARILASCRPAGWEHELTVELLRSMNREFTPKMKPNSPSALAEPTDAKEFSELFSQTYERATAALNQIAEIVHDELMSSWGAPGMAGDAVGILDAVNHVTFQLAALLEVENAFAGTSAPKGLEAVPRAVIGMTQECTEACLRIADDIESAALQGTDGTAVRLDYSLSVDRYFSQAAKDLQVFVNSQRS